MMGKLSDVEAADLYYRARQAQQAHDLLSLIMPNGKAMRDCTSEEMEEFAEGLLRASTRKLTVEAATKK